MSSSSVLAQELFDKVKESVYAEYASMDGGEEGKKLGDAIIKSFKAVFDKPPVAEFEAVLQKPFAPDEVRVCLFGPREDQVRYYVLLLDIAPEAPEGLLKVRSHILSLMFLQHRKNWLFLEEFLLRGGLYQLASMLNDQNLYFRGQVIEIFLTITDCDNFDWFLPKNDALGRTLHMRLLSLAEHDTFLSNLLANRTDSYPGGSTRCLQLLAFWISWVRALYTEHQRLLLSPKMLDELKLWAQGGADADVDEAKAEEVKLARTLLEDFSVKQFEGNGAVDVGGNESPAAESTRDFAVSGITKPDFEGLVIDEATPEAPVVAATNGRETGEAEFDEREEAKDESPRNRALTLKEEGNVCFGKGKFKDALDKYGDALDALSDDEDTVEKLEEGTKELFELKGMLHFNRAASFWKMALKERGGGGGEEVEEEEAETLSGEELAESASGDAPGSFELLRCEQACKQALCFSPDHHKAAYRLAAVCLALGNVQGALEEIEKALQVLTQKKDSKEGEVAREQESFFSLRRRCIAAQILKSKHDTSQSALPLGMSSQTAKIFSALQRRKLREEGKVTHAWAGWSPPVEEEAIKKKSATSTAASSSSIESGLTKNSNKQAAVASTMSAQAKVVKKEKKVEKKVTVNAKAVDAWNKLKRTTALEPAIAAVGQIWSEGCGIKDVMRGGGLDEAVLETLIGCTTSLLQSSREQEAERLFSELALCQNFRSALNMLMYGNNKIKEELMVISEILSSSASSLQLANELKQSIASSR